MQGATFCKVCAIVAKSRLGHLPCDTIPVWYAGGEAPELTAPDCSACKEAAPCYTLACQDGKMSTEGPFAACAGAVGICDMCYPDSACGGVVGMGKKSR